MLYCVLIESPEVLNIIQENHIKSIISLLDKHGRNHKVGSFSVSLVDFDRWMKVRISAALLHLNVAVSAFRSWMSCALFASVTV